MMAAPPMPKPVHSTFPTPPAEPCLSCLRNEPHVGMSTCDTIMSAIGVFYRRQDAERYLDAALGLDPPSVD